MKFLYVIGVLSVLLSTLYVTASEADYLSVELPSEINYRMQILPQDKQVDFLMNLVWENRWNNPVLAMRAATVIFGYIEDSPSDSILATLYNYVGVINYHLNNNYEAVKFFRKAFKKASISGNVRQYAFACNNLALIYLRDEKYEMALNITGKSLTQMRRLHDLRNVAFPLAQYSNIYTNLKQYDSAICYADKIIGLAKADNDNEDLVRGYICLGEAYFAMAKEGYGEEYADKALQTFMTRYDSTALISKIDGNIAGVYLYKGDYENAVKYAFHGFYIGKKYNIVPLISDMATLIMNNIGKTSKKDSASYYMKEFFNLHGFFANKNSGNKIFVINASARLEMQEIIYENYKSARKFQKIFLCSIWLTIAIFSVFLVRQYFYSRRLKQLNKQIAQEEDKDQRLNIELNHVLDSKNKFFAVISDNMQDPINSLLELSQLVCDSYDTFTDADKREFLHLMRQSSAGISALLENLLLWSRTQLGRTKFTPLETDMNYLVNNSIEFLTLPAEEKKIKLINDIAGSLMIVADSSLLITVIRNMLVNAIKYSYVGGEVHFGFTETPDEFYTFYVIDHGVGMSAEQLTTLFDISGSNSTLGTLSEKGTGLGLVICQEYIKLHGGKITVESEKGKGSKFVFTVSKKLMPVGESNA